MSKDAGLQRAHSPTFFLPPLIRQNDSINEEKDGIMGKGL